MTGNEFFNILMEELKELPELNLQRIISFYKNKISIEISKGKIESEIINDFGDPHLICKKYKQLTYLDSIDEYDKTLFPSNFNEKKLYKHCNNNNFNNKTYNIKSSSKVDKFLKIFIIIFGIIVFFPIITSIVGIAIGIFGIALSLLSNSIDLLSGNSFPNFTNFSYIPEFISNFPYLAIILFTLGSFCLSIFFIFIFYYSCKFFFRLYKKLLTF